jgi:ribose 5-phosphate isomerase A
MAKIEKEKTLNNHNWIPQPFQKSAKAIALDAVKQYVKNNQIIGLGSGPMAAAIVREMGKLTIEVKETLQCIASSTQIKREALDGNLTIVDPNHIPQIDVVFDGADQVDSQLNMIKGGGGALLREKILHAAARTIVITAESFKFVHSFNRSIPIEVHPFALYALQDKRPSQQGVKPELRMLNEGYPYVTENGNFVLDTIFQSIARVRNKEIELKNTPGVIEVGLFTKQANAYYKAKDDDSFETIRS